MRAGAIDLREENSLWVVCSGLGDLVGNQYRRRTGETGRLPKRRELSYRADGVWSGLRFETRLQGKGAQITGNDLVFSLSVKATRVAIDV